MGYLIELNSALSSLYDFCVGCSHSWIWVEDQLFEVFAAQNVRILVDA
jgi:hypothetical protein